MKKLITLFTTLIISSAIFAASIGVTPLIINFTPTGKRFADITVTNKSNKDAYVKVTISKIEHAGTANQKRILLTGAPMKFGLVASPTRMVIPPKQVRRVRLLPLIQNNKTDAVYEVNIAPVSGQMESLLSGNKVRAGLQIIVGYAVKVFIRPKFAHSAISILRDGTSVTIKNTGNSNALLYNGSQCEGKKCSLMTENSIHRMYPDNTWNFTLPEDKPVSFVEDFNGKTQQLKSN